MTWESYHYCHLKITLALGGCGLRNGERAEEEVITAGLLACTPPSLNIHTGNRGRGVMLLGKCQTDSLPASPTNYLDTQTATKTGRGYLFIHPFIDSDLNSTGSKTQKHTNIKVAMHSWVSVSFRKLSSTHQEIKLTKPAYFHIIELEF